ncbi:MAG: hypothetical protein M1429_01385 [Patescibacteria group bacterium]|nr:hypothetical protein [Patescibacteria group bacterium]
MIEKDIDIIKREIQQAVADLRLDLTSLTVLTEAANDIFVVTPLIALAAGAKKVYAVSQDSPYGKFSEITQETFKIAKEMGFNTNRLEIVEKKQFSAFSKINIVTNLGHVRPLNKKILSSFKKGTVISYMCEDWEYRPSDFDLDLCQKLGLKVYGTNEEHPLVSCFKETGLIALKLIFESKISLLNARVVILSQDKFGREILNRIKLFTKNVTLVSDFNNIRENQLKNLDLIITADYKYLKIIIGSKGVVKPKTLKRLSPFVKIIQYSSHNDLADIQKAGIPVYPEIELEPIRMAQNLGDISYKAIIRLYAGGLKVGEIAFKKDFTDYRYKSLVQPMN